MSIPQALYCGGRDRLSNGNFTIRGGGRGAARAFPKCSYVATFRRRSTCARYAENDKCARAKCYFCSILFLNKSQITAYHSIMYTPPVCGPISFSAIVPGSTPASRFLRPPCPQPETSPSRMTWGTLVCRSPRRTWTYGRRAIPSTNGQPHARYGRRSPTAGRS